MLARNISRCEDDYHTRRRRALEDYKSDVKRAVEDYLSYLNQYYPFNHHCYAELCSVVMQQLQRLLNAEDFRHNAFQEIRNGKIDWLAEPFFKGEQLSLSSLIEEYDKLRHDPAYRASISCKKLFYISEGYNYSATKSHEASASEWD